MKHGKGPFFLTGKVGYAMGILDKFHREGASGGYVSDVCIAETPLTIYDFSLYSEDSPLNPEQGNPFWEMRAGQPCLWRDPIPLGEMIVAGTFHVS